MRSKTARAMKLAEKQHGVVSLTNLHDSGLSTDQIARLVSSKTIHRVLDGAYRFVSHPESELARSAAVCLSRPGLTIAGPTAARLWGFRRVGHDHAIHVICRPKAQPGRASWLVPYRTACLDEQDIVSRTDGIRLTTHKRTVVDMMRFAADDAVVSMIEQGLDQRWFSEAVLRKTAEEIATPGRPFAKRFLILLSERIDGGPAGSDWESSVGDALRMRHVIGLARQHAINVSGYGNLRFDLAIPEIRWALEVDVHPSHFTREGAAKDKFRDRCCAEAGWLVQRIGEPDLRYRFDETMDALVRHIRQRRASHHNSLDRRRPDVA
jgi:very-short-patch-repair endonuclease